MNAALPDTRTLHASILLLERTWSASALSRGHRRELRARRNDTYTARALEPSSEPLLCLAQGRLHFLCTELHAQLHAWCRSNEKTGLRTTAHIQPIVPVNPRVGGLPEHIWHRGGRRVHGASGAPSPRFQARHLSDSQRVANEAGSHRSHVRTREANRLLAARHTPRGAVLDTPGKDTRPLGVCASGGEKVRW